MREYNVLNFLKKRALSAAISTKDEQMDDIVATLLKQNASIPLLSTSISVL
jgi:hypothetical protein